jgi:hypothetical protein
MVAALSNPATPNPSQLMSKLRMMPDAELFQYAQMHQSDPYIFPLTFQESNARKAMRSAQQMAGAQPPKVVQQDLAQMAPQQRAPRMGAAGAGMPQPQMQQPDQMAQAAALPEDQGIGQLAAPNMQGMAEGGIVGYKSGGTPDYSDEFNNAFEKVLQLEGGAKYIKNDAGKGPTKYGINQTANPDVDVANLTKDQAKQIYKARYWDKIGGDDIASSNPKLATIAFDAAVNQGVKPALRMLDQSEGDPNALLALRQKRYIQLAKNNDNLKQYLPGWTSRVSSLQKDLAPPTEQTSANSGIAKTLTNLMPFGSASAEELPRQAATPTPQAQGISALPNATGENPAISQIPGQSVKAPAYKDENTYFGGLADRLGIPQEYQRNISNTLNALGGYTAPVAGAGRIAKAGASIAEELAPTTAMAQKAEQAAQIANTPRILPPAKAGLEALDEASAATRATAENARRMAQLEQDRQAAVGAGQSIEAATQTTNIANKTAQEIAAAQDAARLNQAKMTGAAQGLSGMQAIDKIGSISDLTAPSTTPDFGDELERLKARYPAPQAAPEEETPTAIAEEPKKGGMDYSDMMLKMGLGLMAGKSPNALTNVGEAGLGALQMTMAEKKAQSEQAMHEALAEMYRQHGTLYGAMPAIKAAQLNAKERLAAEQLINAAMKPYTSNPILYPPDSPKLAAIKAGISSDIYDKVLQSRQGSPQVASAAPAAVPKFLGFE